MNIHMTTEGALRRKSFVTPTTCMYLSSVYSFVNIQLSLPLKPFVTHCTQIRPWLVITDISFSLNLNLDLKCTFTCITFTASNCKQFWKCHQLITTQHLEFTTALNLEYY